MRQCRLVRIVAIVADMRLIIFVVGYFLMKLVIGLDVQVKRPKKAFRGMMFLLWRMACC